MSTHAMAMVWDAPDAPEDPGPMWVLVILADHGNDHGGGEAEDYRCWPSVERVMQRSKFKRSAAETHLKTLVMLGWISRRRRIRPNGRKAVYDYEIHRDLSFRTRMRQAREAIAAAGLKVSGEAADIDHPCVKSTHGGEGEPCVNSKHGPCVDFTHGHRDEPCVNFTHLEPVTLNQEEEEPSAGGRALRAAFDELVEVAPKRAIKFADLEREAWPWFERIVESGIAPDVLIDCARRMAADPELKSRRYLPPLEDWLSQGQWRGWLPDPQLPLAEPGAEAKPAPVGDPRLAELREAVRPFIEEAQFRSYVEPATLQVRDGVAWLVAATGTGHDWIKARCFGRMCNRWRALDAAEPLRLTTKSAFEARARQENA